MTKEREVLISLLQIALGSENKFSLPEAFDWREVVDLAFDQGVAALIVDGLQGSLELRGERLGSLELSAESLEVVPEPVEGRDEGLNLLESEELEDLRYELFGEALQEESDYDLHCRMVAELTKIFSEAGFRSCILKGLSNARLYPNPAHRLCGDIDIWVEGGRRLVLEFIRKRFKVDAIVIHHAHVEIFSDVAVEVHYNPAWLYNPLANRRLQRFFSEEADAQFSNLTDISFATPLPKFNLVYNAVHIYKHYFQKEFNLKQLVDYYCILQHSSAEERREAFFVLKQVGLGKFTSWLMGRLERDLGLSPELALCKASASDTCHRPFGEQFCVLPWKLWHWAARKMYLK